MAFKPCPICGHPQRGAIERGARDAKSLAFIAERYQITDDDLRRHMKKHMNVPAVREGHAEVVPIGANPQALFAAHNDVIREAQDLIGFSKDATRECEKCGTPVGEPDVKGWAAGIREWRGCLDQQNRMLGLYDAVDPKLQNAYLAQYRQVIVEALRPYPEARLAVLEALSRMENSGV